ncbi:hypothetical protein BGZ95_012042 [Linnemannia exigua]|uniref:Yeast cell wall synthesis Kre9/Knh1-like N-terminal domain-containing protein n=1 Tax=Linnemannia exigua TaxID=604196 RepID=A0AAD4D926_9FUNG|nr:hypothetical protein BGZ95_012042 [Linnemannia exigua]
MRFSIIAVVASILSVALAQQAYPTVPVASTVWNAGATYTIKWKLTPPAATAGLKVELLTGDNPQSQRVVADFGTGTPGGTSLSVTLSASLKSGYYSIRIGDSYSSYFLIRGVGPTPTGPLPTAVTTTLPITTVPVTSTVPTSTVAPLPIITTATTPSGPKTTTNGAGFLKAGAVVPVAAAAAAVVLAMAF